MNGPVRLFESCTNDEARELLHAGMAERPRAAALQKTALALGVGATVAVSSTATASAASLAAAPSALLVAAKWVGVGTLLGVALAGGANALSSLAAPSAKASATAAARVLPAAAVSSTAPAMTRQVEVAVAPSAATEKSPATPPKPPATGGPVQSEPRPPTTDASLAEEVMRIDAVRRALATGDTTNALRFLDEYAQKPRTGTLDLEAQLLRIDALERRGDHQAARELARQYLARHPADPHSAKLRTLFGEP